MNLKNFQSNFIQDVLSENPSKNILDDMMIPVGSLSNEEVLSLYLNDYETRLFNVLSDTFKTIGEFLGEQSFTNLAFSYIRNNPSLHYDLNNYGNLFSEYLLNHSNGGQELANLAKFEYQFAQLLTSQGFLSEPVVNLNMELSDPENSVFEFQKEIFIVKMKTSYYLSWIDLQRTSSKISKDEILNTHVYLIFYKIKDEPSVRSTELTFIQYQIMNNLMGGNNLAACFEGINDSTGVEELFHFISQSGILFNEG